MMRRFGLATLLFTAVVSPVRAQEQAGWAYKLFTNKDGRAITEHDFGTVPKGAMLTHRFPLINMYSVPLTIQTRVSCDCVTVSLSKQILQSRESGYMDIQMDTRRFNGPKMVTVFFTVLHPQYTSTALINIKANCRTDVTLNPGGVNFGIVPRGQSVQAAVDVDYAGVNNWQLTGTAKNDFFDVAFAEKYRQPGRSGYRVTLTLKPDAPAGSYKQEVMLTTNDPAGPTVPVPFEVTVQSPMAVFPDPVKLPAARVGTPVEYKLSVRGSGKPFKIIGVEGLSDGVEFVEPMPSAEARPVHILTVRWTPTAVGELNKKIVLKTDAGTDANVHIEGNAAP
jgi:hypothetical protein